MTIDDVRIAVTLLSFASFAGLLLWTWSARRRRGFDEAAQLPFARDHEPHDSAPDLRRSEAP